MKAIYSKYDNEALFVNSPKSYKEKETLISSPRKEGESDYTYSMRLVNEAIGRIKS